MVVGDHSSLARRVVEVGSAARLERLLRRHTESMRGWRLRHLDLRPFRDELLQRDPAGALVLGCALDADLVEHLDAGGALVYPELPTVELDEYRAELYRPTELYAGLVEHGYAATPDARLYAWSHRLANDADDTAGLVARAVHDASIDAALTAAVESFGRPVVGIMGGHSSARGSAEFAAAAELGRTLAQRGLVVATGGGPGAMEAANLGAYLAGAPPTALAEAVALLGLVPSFVPSVEAWVRQAFVVRERWPDVGAPSLGVPTWFYGHEPPNAFASQIAKFFQNSLREATLLERCDAGIVFLPGAAGTVQEIFQDACENYYAGADLAAPMVLVGVEHWTHTLPAYPLLRALAERGGFAAEVVLVDDVASAVAALGADRT